MRRSAPVIMLCALLGACSQGEKLRVPVAGGDAGGLARALPAEEHFDPAALDAASHAAVTDSLQALLIMRHEHIVFERYAHGTDAHSVFDLQDFARSLIGISAGIAVQDDLFPLPASSGFNPVQLQALIESASQLPYADYLSQKLWRPLNAAPAWIALAAAGTPTPTQCCFNAQLLDWMRVADLLVQEGRFEGKQLLSPDWIARMQRPTSADGCCGFGVLLAHAARGAEPFDAQDVFFMRGPGRWRLWLVPSLRLAVLFGSQQRGPTDPAWDETRLPNLIMRALSDRPGTNEHASKLQQLVPAH